MKRLKTILFSLTLIAGVMIAGCSSSSEESGSSVGGKDTESIRMAVDTAAGGSFQFRAADKLGYFQNYGIDAKLSNFAMGIDTVNAVLTEQADTGLAADYALLNSLGKGNMVVVTTLTRGNEVSKREAQLLVNEDINEPSDLKGKKLGVSKGSVYEYVWAKYLEKHQIDEKEISYVPYSTPDEAIVGVKKGDIDAVWISGALTDKFKSIEGVKQLDDLNGAEVSINSYMLAQRSFAEQHPEVLGNVLKSLEEGVEYVHSHKEETAKIAYDQLKVPEEDALKDLERTNYVIGFTKEDVEHLEDMKKWLEEKGILKESYDLKDKLFLEPLQSVLPESVTYQ